MELKTILTVAHLFGVAIGAGGAWTGDFLFFKSIKDKKIQRVEMNLLSGASKLVWVGLAILILSGIGLFLLSPERLINSPKFLAKMTIVSVLTVNGLVFHFKHKKSLEKSIYNTPSIVVSGVVSATSWASALILGALRPVPLAYMEIMFVYVAIVAGGVAFAFLFRNKLFFGR